MLRKDPLHCLCCIIDMSKGKDLNSSLGIFI